MTDVLMCLRAHSDCVGANQQQISKLFQPGYVVGFAVVIDRVELHSHSACLLVMYDKTHEKESESDL